MRRQARLKSEIMTLIIAALIIVSIYTVFAYNSLVDLNNRVKNSWSQVNVQLKKRAELIPSLVSVVKGYAKHESNLFDDIAKLRSEQLRTASVVKKYEANVRISKDLKKIFIIAENYPTLKANENFLELQKSLSSVESKIALSRQFYNDTVYKYNTMLKVFPSNIIGKVFKFKFEESFNEQSSYEGVKL